MTNTEKFLQRKINDASISKETFLSSLLLINAKTNEQKLHLKKFNYEHVQNLLASRREEKWGQLTKKANKTSDLN